MNYIYTLWGCSCFKLANHPWRDCIVFIMRGMSKFKFRFRLDTLSVIILVIMHWLVFFYFGPRAATVIA